MNRKLSQPTHLEPVNPSHQQMLLESLRLAIEDWDIPHRLLPDQNITSGRKAYDVWVEALRSGDFDETGAGYILGWLGKRSLR